MERIELKNLRKEMARYKAKYAKEDEEMLVASGSEVSYNILTQFQSEHDDAEEQDTVDQMIQQRKNKVAGRGQRSSVSAEVYGMFNQKAEFKARVIPKTPDKKSRIVNKVMQSFLFNSLEEKELNTEQMPLNKSAM